MTLIRQCRRRTDKIETGVGNAQEYVAKPGEKEA